MRKHLVYGLTATALMFMSCSIVAEELPGNGNARFSKAAAELITKDFKNLHDQWDMDLCQAGVKYYCKRLNLKQKENGYDASIVNDAEYMKKHAVTTHESLIKNTDIIMEEAPGVIKEMAKHDVKKAGKAIAGVLKKAP